METLTSYGYDRRRNSYRRNLRLVEKSVGQIFDSFGNNEFFDAFTVSEAVAAESYDRIRNDDFGYRRTVEEGRYSDFGYSVGEFYAFQFCHIVAQIVGDSRPARRHNDLSRLTIIEGREF